MEERKEITPKKFSVKRIVRLVLFTLGGFVLFLMVTGYMLERYNKAIGEKIAQKVQEKLEKPYREDVYGGTTPEETLQLFTEALKKGDLELASKYFVLNEQDKALSRLKEYRKANVLDSFINDLSSHFKEVDPLYEGTKRFILYDKDKNETGIFNVIKNLNGLWKLDAVF